MFIRAILFLMCMWAISSGVGAQTLTRDGSRFLLDGIPLSPFGIRAANALDSQSNTLALIATLDLMKEHGIHSVNVSLQCAHTGSCNAYQLDGTLKPDIMARLDMVLEALRVRHMVGVVTLFYVRREGELSSHARIYNAVRNVVGHLRHRRDIWLYAINEPNNSRLDPWAVGSPDIQANIYTLIKQQDPTRITFVNEANHDGFIARTSGQPVCNGDVNVEMDRFDDYEGPGIFGTSDRDAIMQLIRDTHACDGYFFVHAAWHQKSDAPGWPRFDKGGSGTSSTPGMAFAWDTMRNLAQMPVPDPEPEPPGGVHVENRRLMWEHETIPGQDIAGFRVYLRTTPDEPWVKRLEIADFAVRSIDISLAVGTWEIVMTAYATDGQESEHSNTVVAIIEEPDPEPQCPVIEPCQCPICEACPTCPPAPTTLICARGFTALPHMSGGYEVTCVE